MPPPTDKGWFLSTLDAHQRLIHKVCWMYGGSQSDREDLFQEITARLWIAGPN